MDKLVGLMICSAIGLSSLNNTEKATAGPSSCVDRGAASVASLEKFRLDAENVSIILDVAKLRKSLGLDLLPGYPVCTNFEYSASQIAKSKETKRALDRDGITALNYAVGLWSIALAYYPMDGDLGNTLHQNAVLKDNIRFLAEHPELTRVLEDLAIG